MSVVESIVSIMELDDIECPFCGDTGFDQVGLKSHLLNGDCPIFETTERVKRLFDD
jgi:hypothetical protein